MKAPPAFSDTCTKVESYAQLFAVHAADLAQIRKRQQDVKAAKEKAEKCQGHTTKNKTIKALQEENESNLAAAEREKPLQEKVRLQKSAAPKERDVKEVEAKEVGKGLKKKPQSISAKAEALWKTHSPKTRRR